VRISCRASQPDPASTGAQHSGQAHTGIEEPINSEVTIRFAIRVTVVKRLAIQQIMQQMFHTFLMFQ